MGGFWQQHLLSERLTLSAILLALTLLLTSLDWLWRLDNVVYDALLWSWRRPPPEDVVIVAIDAESLAKRGAWPWPRRVHARLLERLIEAEARVVAMDIIFAEKSKTDPAGDEALTDAVARNGRVVLPVLFEQPRYQAVPQEYLPFTPLPEVAAGLGHVHIELDSDGVARSVFLRAGQGRAVWSSMSLAALELLEPDRWTVLPGRRNERPAVRNPFDWVRDYRVMIPFSGPPGHVPRLSYEQVLNREFPEGALRGKIVLVGSTVSGLGDSFPTPVSGSAQAMAGVEIHANVLGALLHGNAILEVSPLWRGALSAFLVLLPALLFPHFSPRWGLMLAAMMVLGTLAVSLFLLRFAATWYAPMPAIFSLVLSYPMWSWRRQESALRYLNRELAALSGEPGLMNAAENVSIYSALSFLRRILPLEGWVIRDADGRMVSGEGHFSASGSPPGESGLRCTGNGVSMTFVTRRGPFVLECYWSPGSEPKRKQMRLLEELSEALHEPTDIRQLGSVEILEKRIEQVQAATARFRSMRDLIFHSLQKMADGVVIADTFGRILVANDRAKIYLGCAVDENLDGDQLPSLLARMTPEQDARWEEAFRTVVVDERNVSFYAVGPARRDLYVQLSRLFVDAGSQGGFIVNLTDISLLKANERKRIELLGFLSHDLRSPLHSIMALIELARARETMEPEELFPKIEAYTQVVLELSENFTQLAQFEYLEASSFRELDLISVAHDAYDQVWSLAKKKGIALRRYFAADSLWMAGEPLALQRALTNLLANGVKYSPPGAVVELRIESSGDGGDLLCSVKDNGYGIPGAELETIFGRFQRGADIRHRRETGSGLGLAIVKIVAEKHGGRVEVKSRLDRGSVFTLILPAALRRDD